jgi:hypothetical protein
MRRILIAAVIAASIGALHAQISVQNRRATMRGSRGAHGKCTIEVRVDGIAEVEISGDNGRLRTIAGQPATWTRFECSDALPRNVGDFRFSGVDGRGRQELVQDPRNSRGIAVVRIEDSKGGSEGYTFDIEWNGGGGPPMGGPGPGAGGYPGRPGSRITVERAVDVCREEVRVRAARELGMRNIDIVSASIEDNPGRRDWVSGTFTERGQRRGMYRFACSVDFANGNVRNVELIRPDGPGMPSQGAYDRNLGIRSCQDYVVAQINRDGYQNIRFGELSYDTRGRDTIMGSASADRGRVHDTFQFSCTLDNAGRVRSADVRRR